MRTPHHITLNEVDLLIDCLRHIARNRMVDARKTIEADSRSGSFKRLLNPARAAKGQATGSHAVIRDKFILRPVKHHHRTRFRRIPELTINKDSSGKGHDTSIVEPLRKHRSHRRPVTDFPLGLLRRNRARRGAGHDNVPRIHSKFRAVRHKMGRCRKKVLHRKVYRLVQQHRELRLRHSPHALEAEPVVNRNHAVAHRIHLTEPRTQPFLMT